MRNNLNVTVNTNGPAIRRECKRHGVWMDDIDAEGNDFLYTRWYSGRGEVSTWEPNNINNLCMLMDPLKSYMWTDSDCAQLHAYVCQQG